MTAAPKFSALWSNVLCDARVSRYRHKVRQPATVTTHMVALKRIEDPLQHVTQDRDSQIAKLTDEHRNLKARIRKLDRHISLTSAERVERAQLKKLKMRTKDQLLRLQQN